MVSGPPIFSMVLQLSLQYSGITGTLRSASRTLERVENLPPHPGVDMTSMPAQSSNDVNSATDSLHPRYDGQHPRRLTLGRSFTCLHVFSHTLRICDTTLSNPFTKSFEAMGVSIWSRGDSVLLLNDQFTSPVTDTPGESISTASPYPVPLMESKARFTFFEVPSTKSSSSMKRHSILLSINPSFFFGMCRYVVPAIML